MTERQLLPAYTCAQCGYGIAVATAALPQCPMCRDASWRAETSRAGSPRADTRDGRNR